MVEIKKGMFRNGTKEHLAAIILAGVSGLALIFTGQHSAGTALVSATVGYAFGTGKSLATDFAQLKK